MADTSETLPTEEELAELPVRAIVAYAARCARRVQPICGLNNDELISKEDLKQSCTKFHTAITLAERWARTESVNSNQLRAASSFPPTRALDYAAYATAKAAITAISDGAATAATAAKAATAATAAIEAVSSNADRGAAISSSRRDFEILKAHRYKREAAVDASESGVCGELWIDAPPLWYDKGLAELRRLAVITKTRRRKSSGSTGNIEEFEKLKVEREELERKQTLLEATLESARTIEASRLAQIAEAEAVRKSEALSHQKTLAELQNLHRERIELQEHLNDSLSRISDQEFELLKVRGELAQVQQKNEVLIVQPLGWYWEKFVCPKSMFQLLALVVLGAMVMFALFGIGEVYERQALDRWVKSQVETQRERLVDRGIEVRPSPNRLDSLEAIRSQLLILSLAGASTRDETIAGLRDQLKSLQFERAGLAPLPRAAMGAPGWWPWFPYQSSDLLLSLVVLFSGTVGAVITTLRRDKPLTLRDLGHGLAAGFITFLAVRGGKSVFLLDADPLLLINPYNSAFFGLLAGMFTELAYGLLSSLAEEMSGRLQNAFSAPKESIERTKQRSVEITAPESAATATTKES